MMQILTLTLHQTTECDREHEVPIVFAGYSIANVVEKFKLWFPDAYEMDLTDEGQAAWDDAASYAELCGFFEQFYCSFAVVLNRHTID